LIHIVFARNEYQKREKGGGEREIKREIGRRERDKEKKREKRERKR